MEKMREVCKHGNKDQLEVLVQVRNDEGLDNGGCSGGSESLDLKCIFKVRPAGLTNSLDAWHGAKRRPVAVSGVNQGQGRQLLER